MNITDLSVADMTNLSFQCSCGKVHSTGISEIIIGEGASAKAICVAAEFARGKIFLLADDNTYGVCGRQVEDELKKARLEVKSFVFPTKHTLVPDEKAVGTLLIELGADTGLIIAVGSGTLNDLARILSSRTRIPYMVVGTAPSMDGYASTVSPLIVQGKKVTYEAVYPRAIVADTRIMSQAPDPMLHAGFGDIIGKYTALADWELAMRLQGEYYCGTIVQLVRNAVEKCVQNAEGLVSRDHQSVEHCAEALILSGVAMGLVGNSRPASGAEHHLAHFWEMDALERGAEHPLHGNMVGVASVVIASIYEMLEIEKDFQIHVPKPETIGQMLRKIGACDSPSSLGLDRELFYRSILHAKEVRPRFTILQYASQKGMLEQCAEKLTQIFFSRQTLLN